MKCGFNGSKIKYRIIRRWLHIIRMIKGMGQDADSIWPPGRTSFNDFSHMTICIKGLKAWGLIFYFYCLEIFNFYLWTRFHKWSLVRQWSIHTTEGSKPWSVPWSEALGSLLPWDECLADCSSCFPVSQTTHSVICHHFPAAVAAPHTHLG